MDETLFRQLLNGLTDADWQAVAAGQGLLLLDDMRLVIGAADAASCILRAPYAGSSDATTLKRATLSDAPRLLDEYYRTHPLTPAGFNRQVDALFTQHGAAAFTAREGERPACTLFVDGGTVVAEPAGSPRHPYGAYCELAGPRDGADPDTRARQWLERGEAYEQYLGMNVCRYNC